MKKQINNKKEYEVIITETLQRRVKVKSTSKDNAIDIIQLKYYQGEIILTDVDFTNVMFTVRKL